MKTVIFVFAFLTAQLSWGSAARVLDGATITNGSATLTLPTTTTTIIGNNTTDSLSNKTLVSPAISSPTGLTKSDVGLSNVDNTSDATKNSATATLTNKSVDGASNTLTNIPAANLSGQVPVANGGTGSSTLTSGSVVVGNGTSAVSLVAPGTSGNILTSNGSTWTSAAAPSSAPSVTGTRASPTSITAVGGISFSGSNYTNIAFIQGNAGAVTVSANPQIVAGTLVGQSLRLISRSASNTVTIADGNGLSLNGPWVGGLDSIISLVWDGTSWVEQARR